MIDKYFFYGMAVGAVIGLVLVYMKRKKIIGK